MKDLADKWNAHVVQIRDDLKEKKAHHDAKEADVYANMVISCAIDAIDFAQAAVYEAEYAVLDALSARAAADSMVS